MNNYSVIDPRSALPPGDYYIGDPCYVIHDYDWMNALEGTRYFGLFDSDEAMNSGEHKYAPANMRCGVFMVKTNDGKEFLLGASQTKHGDGEYPCEDHGVEIGKCPVDAGLISAIPMEFIKRYGVLDSLGVQYHFKRPFHVHYSDDTGAIKFGNITVLTGDDDEYDPYSY